MLIAEINNQPINCYDNKYDKDTLKKMGGQRNFAMSYLSWEV